MNVRLELVGADLGGAARSVVQRLAGLAGVSDARSAALGRAAAEAVALAAPGDRVVLDASWEPADGSAIVVQVKGLGARATIGSFDADVDVVRLIPDGVELRLAVTPPDASA